MKRGIRIPVEGFITKGVGRSDISEHAGSFHLALRACGIERFNIINYSSIIPANCVLDSSYRKNDIPIGSVVEVIMSRIDLPAGVEGHVMIGVMNLTKDGKPAGSIVAENKIEGGDIRNLKWTIKNSLWEIYNNGFVQEDFMVDTIMYESQHLEARDTKFNTAIVAIAFTKYDSI